MFDNHSIFETTFAGRQLLVETGKTCELSNGSCWVKYGDTVVMANVTAAPKPREGIDYLPLSVDFEERMYAVGKIPGGYLKREGRASEKAILTSRVVARPMRPLFPKDLRNDIALVMTVLAVDPEVPPEIIGMIGASIAVSVSDIPWDGPIGGISVGLVDDEIVLMPNAAQRAKSDLQLTVSSSEHKVVMIEAGANEVDDETMLRAIEAAHAEITASLIPFIKDITAKIGKKKFEIEKKKIEKDVLPAGLPPLFLFDNIKNFAIDRIRFALDTDDKNVREARLQPVKDDIHVNFDNIADVVLVDECIYNLQKYVLRKWLM